MGEKVILSRLRRRLREGQRDSGSLEKGVGKRGWIASLLSVGGRGVSRYHRTVYGPYKPR